jgi:alkaline phosphatase
VGKFLRDYLDLDVAEITEELKEAKKAGKLPDAQMVGVQTVMGPDHYEGDFKKRSDVDCGCGTH